MATETIALVPYVLHVGESHHPWRAAPIEPLKVLGDTPPGVRLTPGTLPGVTARPGHGVLNRPHHLVYCLPYEASSTEAQQIRDAWQAALDALAGALRNPDEGRGERGRYDERLAAAGKGAPNPLTRNCDSPVPATGSPLLADLRVRVAVEQKTPLIENV